MDVDRSALPDRTWAICAGLAGLTGIASYLLLIVLPDASAPVGALLGCAFSIGFMMVGIGSYFGVTRLVSPRLGILAAVANTVAGAELTAMLLVQIAVKTAAPRPGAAMTGIWLGLDVAWDVFGAAGTVLLAWSLWSHRRFHPLLALSGIVAGLALLALNIGTFPTPPAEAGWVDLGPLVALWYTVACVWLVVVARRRGAGPEVAGAPRQSQDVPASVGAD